MKDWRRSLFYLCREALRLLVIACGTLFAVGCMVYILEDPGGRFVFYLISCVMVALAIGNVFYGKDSAEK